MIVNSEKVNFGSIEELITINFCYINKKKIEGKVFYGQEPPEENLMSLFVSSVIVDFSNASEITQWIIPKCSRLKPTTDYGIRGQRPN